MHRNKYDGYMLKKFNMINCNAAVTPIEIRDKLSRRLVRNYLMQLYMQGDIGP